MSSVRLVVGLPAGDGRPPGGTEFAAGQDSRGPGARDRRDLKASIAVCDIGFRTPGLFAVEEGRVESRCTIGDRAGMSRAAGHMIDMLRMQ